MRPLLAAQLLFLSLTKSNQAGDIRWFLREDVSIGTSTSKTCEGRCRIGLQ